MIVVDASAVVAILLDTGFNQPVLAEVDPEESLHAPHLLLVEVTHALRRQAAMGALSNWEGRAAIADLLDLEIEYHHHQELLDRVWGLRHNLSAYDALYVALAEVLEAPLLTLDARMAAATGHDATVRLLQVGGP